VREVAGARGEWRIKREADGFLFFMEKREWRMEKGEDVKVLLSPFSIFNFIPKTPPFIPKIRFIPI